MKTPLSPLLVGLALACGCAKAPPATEAVAPQEGYYRIEGTTCYAAPDLAAMTRSEQQRARIDVTQAAKAHWRGEVEPAVQISASTVTELQDRFLNHPDDIGPILAESQRLCERWAQGEIDLKAWEDGLLSFSQGFDKGRCEPQIFGTMAQNLSLSVGWQMELPVCAGQSLQISVSDGRYTIAMPEAEGVEPLWIDANGSADIPTEGVRWPCDPSVCAPGQVVARFVPWDGPAQTLPIGKAARFEAPAHGTLSFGINDERLTDNRFFDVDNLPEFLLIEVKPADM